MLRWIAGRASAFAAFDSQGGFHYFDLLRDASAPCLSGKLPNRVSSRTVDVSSSSAGGSTLYAAMRTKGDVCYRKLWVGLTTTHKQPSEEEALEEAIAQWGARTTASDFISGPESKTE